MPDIHPAIRFIVIKTSKNEWPSRIDNETASMISTPSGLFDKAKGHKWDDPETRFTGPYNQDGVLE